MKKSELIERMYKRCPHLYQIDVRDGINVMLREISDALADGRDVHFRGIGLFQVKTLEPSEERDPRTGEVVHCGERKRVRFRPAQRLAERIFNVMPKED